MLREDESPIIVEPVFCFNVLIGICAYNEENNIGRLLQTLTSKRHIKAPNKILVVCSGCTDRTADIVRRYRGNDVEVDLVTEPVRRGKSNALNNIFRLARYSSDILILVNADATPANESLTQLISRLTLSNVGAAVAQPVPLESSGGTSHKISRVIWRLHHLISLETPKLSGELCAVRASCLGEIPENIATDEPYIEAEIRAQHKSIVYVPEAVVYIRCPTNILDLLKQRKRIWIGHMQYKASTGNVVYTSKIETILRATTHLKLKEVPYAFLGAIFEFIAYIQAKISLHNGKIPFAWEPIRSAKVRLPDC